MRSVPIYVFNGVRWVIGLGILGFFIMHLSNIFYRLPDLDLSSRTLDSLVTIFSSASNVDDDEGKVYL